MYRTGKVLCVAFATVALGCQTNGYLVKIETKEVPSIAPALRERLSKEAKSKGFSIQREGAQISAFPDDVIDSYSRVLSDAPHDVTVIQIVYGHMTRPPASVVITVYNEVRGREDPVKAEIDILADRFRAELSQWFGASNVTVTEGKAPARYLE